MLFLCPRCLHPFRYDPHSDSFSLVENIGLSRRVPIIIGFVSISAAAYIAIFFTGWWTYFVGTFLILIGWRSLKTGLFATNREIAGLATSKRDSKEKTED